MRIALINGSPKVKRSASGELLEDLRCCISGRAEIVELGLHSTVVPEEGSEELQDTDAWVFAFPLYVDGIPAHLLSCLMQLEQEQVKKREIPVYGIVNCGFYEGIQAEYALKLLQNWCVKAGFIWGGGIGVGGGGGLESMPRTESGHGPRAPIDKALGVLADKILQCEAQANCEAQENQYVSVAFPRFLYKMAAQMGWRRTIRANGGKAGDLGICPEAED